jgi:hypothetical protein
MDTNFDSEFVTEEWLWLISGVLLVFTVWILSLCLCNGGMEVEESSLSIDDELLTDNEDLEEEYDDEEEELYVHEHFE